MSGLVCSQSSWTFWPLQALVGLHNTHRREATTRRAADMIPELMVIALPLRVESMTGLARRFHITGGCCLQGLR